MPQGSWPPVHGSCRLLRNKNLCEWHLVDIAGPATGLGMAGFTDFLNQYILGPNNQIGGSSSTDESVALDPAPGPDTGSSSSTVVPPVVSTVPPQNGAQGGPPVVGEEDNTDIVEPMPVNRRPDALPSDIVESRLPGDDAPPEDDKPKTVFDELKQILGDHHSRGQEEEDRRVCG